MASIALVNVLNDSFQICSPHILNMFCASVYVCMYVCLYVCMYVYVRACMHVCICKMWNWIDPRMDRHTCIEHFFYRHVTRICLIFTIHLIQVWVQHALYGHPSFESRPAPDTRTHTILICIFIMHLIQMWVQYTFHSHLSFESRPAPHTRTQS